MYKYVNAVTAEAYISTAWRPRLTWWLFYLNADNLQGWNGTSLSLKHAWKFVPALCYGAIPFLRLLCLCQFAACP